MTKTTYTATFADGTSVTRKSERAYAVAWKATYTNDHGQVIVRTGFAVSQDKAKPEAPTCALAHRRMSPADKAAARKRNEEFLARSGYRVEFAPARAGGAPTDAPLDPPGYAARVAELVAEGMTNSDAQAVADAEFGGAR